MTRLRIKINEEYKQHATNEEYKAHATCACLIRGREGSEGEREASLPSTPAPAPQRPRLPPPPLPLPRAMPLRRSAHVSLCADSADHRQSQPGTTTHCSLSCNALCSLLLPPCLSLSHSLSLSLSLSLSPSLSFSFSHSLSEHSARPCTGPRMGMATLVDTAGGCMQRQPARRAARNKGAAAIVQHANSERHLRGQKTARGASLNPNP